MVWTSSDVWNQHAATAPDIDPATDQPRSALPRAGAAGSNHAFARIHRASGSGPQRVTARFLYADFGMGSAFRDLGTAPPPEVAFGPAENSRAVAYEWRLPDLHSPHVCLAVEIAAPGDPLRTSLRGRAPGGATDPLVRGDNNKAQRNIDFPAAMPGAGGAMAMALVRNPSTTTRDMTVAYAVAPEARAALKGVRVRVIDPAGSAPPVAGKPGLPGVLLRLLAAVVRLFRRLLGIGAEPEETWRPRGTLTLAEMRPGESRWIEVEAAVAGGATEPLPVHFHEVREGRTINGFTIAPRPASLEEVAGENLARDAVVLARYRAAGSLKGVVPPPVGQQPGKVPGAEYLAVLPARLPALGAAVEATSPLAGDPFRARDALAALRRALRTRDAVRAAEAHARLLTRLDGVATALRKREGDPAEVLHNVLWQVDIARRIPALTTTRVAEECEAFVRAWDAGHGAEEEYAALVERQVEALRRAVAALGKGGTDLSREMELVVGAAGHPARLQRAHRALLLALDRVAPAAPARHATRAERGPAPQPA